MPIAADIYHSSMDTPAAVDTPIQQLLAFRHAIYEHGFTNRRDAQFELLDAVLLSSAIHSFPELSCLPIFRRRWPSIYAAIEDGRQDTAWLQQYLTQQLSITDVQVFALDGTSWARPSATTLPDRQYVYTPTKAVNGGSVVVGVSQARQTRLTPKRVQQGWGMSPDDIQIVIDALTIK